MSCSYAGPALGRLVDIYQDSFAFVQFHVFDENATTFGDERWVFNGGDHTPLAVFGGVDSVVGAVSDVDQQYTIYRINHFLPQRATVTDVTIDLSGIAVRNAILLIDFVHKATSTGQSLEEALLASGAVRLRPIFLTAGTAMLAAWPITLDPIFSGLAWALIFGLFVSTVFTLVVIPVVYHMVYGRRTT